MESNEIREIVAQWRKQKTPFGGSYDWTGHAAIFFEGARAGAAAAQAHNLVADLDLLLRVINTQGVNPLLAMAPL